MIALFYLTILLYVVLGGVVLYSSFMGLRMCFQADVDFGFKAMIMAMTIFGMAPLFIIFWIKVIWKRDMAEEFYVLLYSPPPRKLH